MNPDGGWKKIPTILGTLAILVLAALVLVGIFKPSLLRRVLLPGQPPATAPAENRTDGNAEVPSGSLGTLRFIWGVSGVGSGSKQANKNEVDGVGVDGQGNVYVSGVFNNTVNIGEGLLTLTSRGIGDIFVMKFSKTGSLLWSHQYGSTGDDNTYDVDVDQEGSMVLNGYFAGTVDFDGIALTSKGSQDQFVVKMSPDGKVLWAKNFGGSSGDGGNEVAVGDDGSIYAAAMSIGAFAAGSQSFDNFGRRDSYVLKMTSGGDVQWVRNTSGTGNERLRAIAVDSEGAVFGGYEFSGDLKVGNAVYRGKGGLEGAIAKWDAQGNQLWSGYVGSAGDDMVRGISPGPNGSFYVSGLYGKEAEVFGQSMSAEGSGSDVFIAKFGRSNTLEWIMTFSSPQDEGGGEVESDGAGNVAFSTDIYPDTTIKLNGDIVQTTSPGQKRQAALVRIDPQGKILSITTPDSSTESSGQTLGVSNDGRFIAQSINFGGTLTYAGKKFTAQQGNKSFLLVFYSSE